MVDAAIAVALPDAAVGDDPEAASKVPAARPRPLCQVRVTKTGLLLFDEVATRKQIVITCKPGMAVRVILDEGYKNAEWTALKRALDAAKIRIVRGFENPLAKGC
jgi:hypothetical protein